MYRKIRSKQNTAEKSSSHEHRCHSWFERKSDFIPVKENNTGPGKEWVLLGYKGNPLPVGAHTTRRGQGTPTALRPPSSLCLSLSPFKRQPASQLSLSGRCLLLPSSFHIHLGTLQTKLLSLQPKKQKHRKEKENGSSWCKLSTLFFKIVFFQGITDMQ